MMGVQGTYLQLNCPYEEIPNLACYTFRNSEEYIFLLQVYLIIFFIISAQFNSVQSLTCVRLFATPWTAARQASLSITSSWNLLKLMAIELLMPSNHLILCRPLLLLPPIPPSIRVFSNESTLHMRWPKYWSFSISPSNEHSGQISFRMDWLDLLSVQGTLKSLLQHHSSKASILQHSAFFIVQLLHPYRIFISRDQKSMPGFKGQADSLVRG